MNTKKYFNNTLLLLNPKKMKNMHFCPKGPHLSLYKVCAVQAESVQYRLRQNLSTGEGCVVQAKSVQYRLRQSLSTG